MIDIPNAMQYGDYLVGGQPTFEQIQDASKAGYKIIVNLQMEHEPGTAEERALVESLGMEYVSLPVAGANGMTRDNAHALHHALERAGNQKVMVHCKSGNRVGGIFALRARYMLGMSADDALQEGLRSGLTGLKDTVENVLRQD